MSDEKLAERATAYIAKQRAQFTDGFSAIHTAHLRLQAALDVAIKERAEARADVDRLRGDRDKMLLNERDFVRKHRAEIERLTRERDEVRAEVDRLRAALKPFSELYLWPDDADEWTANEVRSDEDWDEKKNDAQTHDVFITRGHIRAARKALEGKP